MAEPFISEIRMMSFGFAPRGWAYCNGQVLPIAQNAALFSLLGTTYGGNGQTTFQLPNMQGRVPVHVGPRYSAGQVGGEATHTLTANEVPSHTHVVNGSSVAADTNVPGNTAYLGFVANTYATFVKDSMKKMAASEVGVTGGVAHQNMQPYLAVNFVIALQGIFPSQS